MSNRVELKRLTKLEKRVLGALCALKDAGAPVIAMHAADRLGIERTNAYKAIGRLRAKGWVIGGNKVGYRRPLHIAALPLGMPKQTPYGKPAATFDHRHPDDRPSIRRCLGCGEDFNSSGWGNRMCPHCQRGAQPAS